MVAARNAKVLDSAFWLAKNRGGLPAVTREAVARETGLSVGTVSNAFGAMDALREEVVKMAVRQGILEIVAQALASGSDAAKTAGEDLKFRALATLA